MDNIVRSYSILRKNQLTHSANQTVKKLLSVNIPYLGYFEGGSRKYETETVILCGYQL